MQHKKLKLPLFYSKGPMSSENISLFGGIKSFSSQNRVCTIERNALMQKCLNKSNKAALTCDTYLWMLWYPVTQNIQHPVCSCSPYYKIFVAHPFHVIETFRHKHKWGNMSEIMLNVWMCGMWTLFQPQKPSRMSHLTQVLSIKHNLFTQHKIIFMESKEGYRKS